MGNVSALSYAPNINQCGASASLLDIKKESRNRRLKREALFRQTEHTDKQDAGIFDKICKCYAVQTHLKSFSAIASYAVGNGLHMAYGEYSKRMPYQDVKKEWHNITTWLHANVDDNILFAITIGVHKSGMVYVRYLLTDDYLPVKVHDTAIRLACYLRKKHYKPIQLKPFEGTDTAYIQHKYNNDSVSSLHDMVSMLYDELFQVFRASLLLHKSHRTYRTNAVELVIKSNTKAIPHEQFDTLNSDFTYNNDFCSLAITK